MSFVQAFECVEEALTKCGVLDRYGDPLTGLEAIGKVSGYDPKAWQDLEDSLERQNIDADQYQAKALQLIQDFCRFRNRSAIEAQILALSRDQQERGLVPRPPGACI